MDCSREGAPGVSPAARQWVMGSQLMGRPGLNASREDGRDSQGLKKGPQQLVDRRMGRVEGGVTLPPF